METREFKYLESEEGISFEEVFPQIIKLSGAPLPKSGGMINENRLIILPEGIRLHGVSYKGDLEGWRRIIHQFCEVKNLQYGDIDSGMIVTNRGRRQALDDCVVEVAT